MRVLFVSLSVFLLDQASKLYIKGFSFPFLRMQHSGMYEGQRIPIFGNLFNITFVENSGIAFGIYFGIEFKLIISLLTILAAIGLFYYLIKIKDKSLSFRLSVALILGGALGNLTDRIFYGLLYGYSGLFYGKVVDFFDIRIFNLLLFNKSLSNYVFNIADIAVTAGVFMLLFSFSKKPSTIPIEKYLSDSEELS